MPLNKQAKQMRDSSEAKYGTSYDQVCLHLGRLLQGTAPNAAIRLTVKLSGRTQASDWSRGRTLSSRARGDTAEHHGPLQRLLEVRPHRLPLCACGAVAATAADGAPVCSAPSWQTEPLRAW